MDDLVTDFKKLDIVLHMYIFSVFSRNKWNSKEEKSVQYILFCNRNYSKGEMLQQGGEVGGGVRVNRKNVPKGTMYNWEKVDTATESFRKFFS